MTFDKGLLDALMPERWQVFRLELRPFCLGHQTTLFRINSPFVLGDSSNVTLNQLFLSVAICSMTWEQGIEFLNDAANVELQLRKVADQCKATELEEKIGFFIKYLEDGQKIPDYQCEESSGVSVWTPWQQRMRVRLMKDLRLSESEVMNRPLARNWWDYLTLEELDGNLRICTEEEKQTISDRIAQAEALWLAQQN